ncbi:MAG: WD40/YVTN/BNR-like repeat-containing protein [Janthinobacterium lividum]
MKLTNLTFGTGLALLSTLASCVLAQTAAPKSVPYIWKEVQIGGGGFVDGIDFSPKQRGLIYARTDIGGAYRWDMTTNQWVPLTDWIGQDNANLLGIESIGVDPTDARRVYLAVGTYTQPWASNGAILRSVDQGRHWQQTDMPFKMGGNEDGRSIGERLAVDPSANHVLYFGSRNDGLWKSADYGATWAKVDSFPVTGRTNGIGVGFVVFDPKSSSPGTASRTIYVGVPVPGGSTLYRSTDSGATWAAVPGQPSGLLPHHGVLDSHGVMYLSYGNAPGPNGMSDGAVWKYDTNTSVWTDITPVKPGSETEGGFGYAGLSLDAGHPGTLMVASMDKWRTGDDIYRSTDGGSHWTALKPHAVRDSAAAPFLNWTDKTPALGHWMGALAIDPFAPGHVLYGTGATLWGSDDVTALDAGTTSHWTVRAAGLEETAVMDILSPPAGAHLVSALGDIGGFRHDDLSASPVSGIRKNPVMNTTDSMDFAEQNPLVIARVGGSGPQYGAYSLDEDISWTPFAGEPAGTRGGGAIAVSADGSTFVWAPRGGALSYSRDRGATWTASTGADGNLQLTADRVNPLKFYALDSGAGKVYVSTDGGANFSATGAVIPTGGRLRAIPRHEGDLWLAAREHGLLHSTDGGGHFNQVVSVTEGYALGSGKAAPGKTYPALYLAGTVGGVKGVFRSDNSGATWVRINDDQHQYGWIGQVVIGDPRLYGRVYLGTNGRGILYADPVSAQRLSRNDK